MSDIYLILLLSLLIIICIIITSEIFRIIKREMILHHLEYKLKIDNFIYSETLNLPYIYILKRLWLKCIIQLEKQIKSSTDSHEEYYYIVGTCYFNMKLYNLATKYYIKAINIMPTYTLALNSLGKVHELNDKKDEAAKIYQYILKYDLNNNNAKHRLNNLQNRDSRI